MNIRDEVSARLAQPRPEVKLHRPDEPAAVPKLALNVIPFAGRRIQTMQYLVPGRIPLGKLILCGARGGSGKSTLWRAIAADISAGRCALGLSYPDPVRAKVLFFASEDGADDTALPGLLAAQADLLRVAFVDGVERGPCKSEFMLTPDHIRVLRERLEQSPDIKLVIFDPIASYVGRAKVDDHRASELRLVLDPLSELAESKGVTIVMIAHLNKSTGDAVDRFAGSAAYRDTVRAAYAVSEDPEDSSRRLFMPVKENLPGFDRSTIPFSLVPLTDAEMDAFFAAPECHHLNATDRQTLRSQLRRVKFDPPRTVDPNQAMKPPTRKESGTGSDNGQTKLDRCKEWLRNFLQKYAYPSSEIAEAGRAEGYTFDNLKFAKARLKEEGVISHSNSVYTPGAWWSGPGPCHTWKPRPELPDFRGDE
ncbi:AAA family ATPase [Gemmata sp. SH-PL17]|uniref:AAA family ATPase n=1 Tax=Gemmata sp. SH-PL17 TaxID=1630693 RepID=UPI0009EEAB07|nr:AAA family ATPase [Gemmata sp. SH-PL17]